MSSPVPENILNVFEKINTRLVFFLQAIQRANNVEYGLCATLWTESGSRIHRIAPQLEVCSLVIQLFC